MSGQRFKSLLCGSLCQEILELEFNIRTEAVKCGSVLGECGYMITVICNSDTNPGYTSMDRIQRDTAVLKATVTENNVDTEKDYIESGEIFVVPQKLFGTRFQNCLGTLKLRFDGGMVLMDGRALDFKYEHRAAQGRCLFGV